MRIHEKHFGDATMTFIEADESDGKSEKLCPVHGKILVLFTVFQPGDSLLEGDSGK